ncbi:family 16 glycosylhydrolase [Niabella hibiscisoli]|uniref:family 16 glycosylhydrolase n=1 Tax=Niabella hibiscisoli TaxID=1825928 RepID=UPI00374D72E5
MRARIPHGQGVLPAFWLRRKDGASWGEVDIMEYFGGYRPGYSKFTLHFPNTIGANTTQQHVFLKSPLPEPAAGMCGRWKLKALMKTITSCSILSSLRPTSMVHHTGIIN